MNVFRSLARNLWNAVEIKGTSQPEPGAKTLNAVREQRVPGVLGLSRFRDGFEQFPQGVQGTLRALQAERAFRPQLTAASLQRDGFEGGHRAPVDLSGGVKAPAFEVKVETPAAAPSNAGFTASLDDLAQLF